MSTVVFVGPTIPRQEVLGILPGADVRPPAGCGDVHRAVSDGAATIALVDGYFDHQLSVWHKEILFALSRGVEVWGAASMGALRAAELASFGMHGVGKVFEAYRDGVLEADDEVAVAHQSAERGYLTVSDALVNVRATLERAVASGALSSDAARELVAAGRSLFYPQRTFAAVVARACERGFPEPAGAALLAWLDADPSRRVDQKRADALALCRALATPAEVRERTTFHFEYTEVWHELVRQLDARKSQPPLTAGSSEPPPATRRVGSTQAPPSRPGKVMASTWSLALERALALTLAQRFAGELDESSVQQSADRFRREHGLLTPEATLAWMQARGLDLESFSARMREEALATQLTEQARRLAEEQLAWIVGGARWPKSSEIG